MACSLKHEEQLLRAGIFPVAGIDEAGRGALAGPVVVAAVVLPEGFCGDGLDDSKKLSRAARETYYERLVSDSEVRWGVVSLSSEEVDRLNILRATHEGMRRVVNALPRTPQHVLIDGLPVRDFPVSQTALVGGDGISLSIAAASVIAKVTRDRMMVAVGSEFPQYGFEKHKGYGTAEHLARLQAIGPCSIHRKSFEPVSQLRLPLW